MPKLAAQFGTAATYAIRLSEIGEIARLEARPNSKTFRNLHPARLEQLYELSYLRVFVAWEALVEGAFFRYCCGYSYRGVIDPPPTGKNHSSTLAAAEAAVLGGNKYLLWHNPDQITKRCKAFLDGGGRLGAVVDSNIAQLRHLAAVRHRITHAQQDAMNNFNAATLHFAARRYRGSRAGAFLRDRASTLPTRPRWLSELVGQLTSIAGQIA